MKHRLSFGYFKVLSENILEVTADQGVEITLEMLDECNDFISAHFKGDFGMLINRVNQYTYSFEAQLSVASYGGLKALAFVYYSPESEKSTKQLQKVRAVDKWNARLFSGLELGWQNAYESLQQELALVKTT